MRKDLFLIVLMVISLTAYNQGIEDVIVEKYYTVTSSDTVSGLPEGSVTYRIYIDIAEGYRLQTIFGVPGHPLRIQTTTTFYNHQWGASTGDQINSNMLNEGNYCLDSWMTINAASKLHLGVLLKEDNNGSVLIKDSLLKVDGLLPGKAPDLFKYELNLDVFDQGGSLFETENSILAVLGGVAGPTTENKILIAQLTTDGELSFELNIQLGVNETGNFEQYVAKDAINNEIMFNKLNYNN